VFVEKQFLFVAGLRALPSAYSADGTARTSAEFLAENFHLVDFEDAKHGEGMMRGTSKKQG
jgi:hypothetical protein